MKLIAPTYETASDMRGFGANELSLLINFLEASPGIEPVYKDLQSSASPLRHEAIAKRILLWWPGFRIILNDAQEGRFEYQLFLF